MTLKFLPKLDDEWSYEVKIISDKTGFLMVVVGLFGKNFELFQKIICLYSVYMVYTVIRNVCCAVVS
ncbi:MAG: hypothetical protein LBQ66_05805 [Planctomycetaceae bacterium]|nr:hypothetical protein [Planctomycetaceae bacterium]